MVTASIAGGYSREVMVVPGRTSDPYSEGCNHLIATNQATMIRDASDLIAACRWVERNRGGCPGAAVLSAYRKGTSCAGLYCVESGIYGKRDVGRAGYAVRISYVAAYRYGFKDLIIAVPGGRYALSTNSVNHVFSIITT